MKSKYQTLSGFMLAPFHNRESLSRDAKYNAIYRRLSSQQKIFISAMTVVEDSYYIHIKVPSESQTDGKYYYDVVIRFFTNDKEINKQSTLMNYYVQFYSNSPSFIYQYAYLYKQEGFLIEALYDKLDSEYIDKAPEKSNASMTLSYDKSIFIACKYLADTKFKYLTKMGPILSKKKNNDRFFRDISDFKSVKFDREIINEEKKLSKTLQSTNRRDENSTKKTAQKTTSRKGISSITIIPKKGAKAKITKKVARKTTIRKK